MCTKYLSKLLLLTRLCLLSAPNQIQPNCHRTYTFVTLGTFLCPSHKFLSILCKLLSMNFGQLSRNLTQCQWCAVVCSGVHISVVSVKLPSGRLACASCPTISPVTQSLSTHTHTKERAPSDEARTSAAGRSLLALLMTRAGSFVRLFAPGRHLYRRAACTGQTSAPYSVLTSACC